jgi:phospholipase C
MLGAAALPACATREEEAAAGASEDELSLLCIGKRPPVVGPDALRKYEKFVVLMMENRSFDHYFGHLSLPRELGGEGRTDVDGFRGDESNPGPDGSVPIHHANTFALGDVVHEWDPCRLQFNGGRNDGFVKAQLEDLAAKRFCSEPVDSARGDHGGSCADAKDAMAYFRREDTPVYHQLMDEYALCDRWFSSILGPTWPNRYYLHCGTAFGAKGGNLGDIRALPTTRTIFEALAAKCVEATNFFADFPWALKPLGRVRNLAPLFDNQPRPVLTGISNLARPVLDLAYLHQSFERHCKEGTLPPVSFLDPKFLGASADDHAPTDIRLGQAFVLAVYNMLKQNEEQWKKTLFIVTYDEHGGFYDHVAPPKTFDENPDFTQLGFRVPTLLVGPYVKKGINKNPYDHTSILSSLTRRFGLEPLNERVARTNDLADAIDPNLLESDPSEPVTLQPMSLSHSAALESVRAAGWHHDFDGLGIKPHDDAGKREDLDVLLANLDRVGAVAVGR